MLCILRIVLLALCAVRLTMAVHSWDYELISIEATSATGSVEADVHPKRISRGEYGIDGDIVLHHDLDNSIMVEVKVYRSPKGNNQYELHPFRVTPTPLYEFLNNVYKKFIMEDIKNFSNFPQSDDFKSPILKGKYYIKNYVCSKDSFPAYVQTGVYKLLITFKSVQVNVECVILVKIIPTV